ncbi:hypothetical protein ACVI1J_009675 [Bradyrhizobium diazoefficiens]
MDFNAAELAALDSGIVKIGIFFRLDVEPDPVRLWLGYGAIEPGINVYDTAAGATYLGLGELQNVPAIKQLINGAAERVEFTLSGVSGEVLAIASGNDADAIKGAPATLGFGLFGDTWSSLLGALHWCGFYVADYLERAQAVAVIGDTITRTVTLSCGSRFTGRRRPDFSYFTDQDQQARHPGDKSCSLTPNYAHGFTKKWPVF